MQLFVPLAPMTISQRYALSLLTLALTVVSLPHGASACGGTEHSYRDYGNGGVFQTPYMARGQFIFVTRVSRRVLRELVAEHQQPIRPALPRAEI